MGLSIVIIANCDPHILQHTIESIMEQEYEGNFEVIVVRHMQKDDTLDMLEPLTNRFGNLRSTFRPDDPQYITDYEVEIMLGVKAARYDNIVMIASDFTLPCETWLSDVAKMTEDMASQHMLLGNAAYSENTGFFGRHSHKSNVRKALGKWCKSRGLAKSDIKMDKDGRKMFIVALSQKEYIDEPLMRDVIYKQIDA